MSTDDLSKGMSSEDVSKKHVTFCMDDDEHMIKLEKLCSRLNTDCFYGLTCRYARNLLKKDGANKYSRPKCEEKKGLMKKVFGGSREWSKRDWNKVFNGRSDDVYCIIRDGQKSLVRRKELVRGDLVCLQPGEIVPADMRVVSYDGELIVDNRVITGNSAEYKSISATSRDPLLSQNMIFACTEILRGRCDGIVLRTGDETVFGELTQFATKVRYVKRHHSSSVSSNGGGSTCSSLGNLSLPSSPNLSEASSENLSEATSSLSL